jgi:hypothetical protein
LEDINTASVEGYKLATDTFVTSGEPFATFGAMKDTVEATELIAAVRYLTRRPRAARRPFPTVRDTADVFVRLAGPRSPELREPHQWVPGHLAHLGESWWRSNIHWYVVVDDVEGDVAVLTVSSWPTLDDRHRLTFDANSKHELNVGADWLHGFLERTRTSVSVEGELAVLTTSIRGVAAEMRTRPLRVGDVYAFSDGAHTLLGSQGDWAELGLMVFDVTGEARDEAKIAFYAAAAGSIDPDRKADRTLAEVTWAERKRAETEGMPERNR